ncbi:MAG: hypothetical protein ACLPH3_13100 [Terracidiphilus sp.]
MNQPLRSTSASAHKSSISCAAFNRSVHGLSFHFAFLPPVRYLSTRIAVMEHGRLVETGEAVSLCNAPLEAYTRQLLAATPELPAGAA